MLLVIVHEGHQLCDPAARLADAIEPDAVDLIGRLLDRADVLYLDMPMLGINCGQTFAIKDIAYSGLHAQLVRAH